MNSKISKEKSAIEKKEIVDSQGSLNQQNIDNASEEITEHNIEKAQKELSTSELFELSSRVAEKITSTKQELETLHNKREELKNLLEETNKELEPVSRTRKKTHVLPAKNSLTKLKRRELKTQKEDIKNQIILLDDQIFSAERKYSSLTGRTIIELKQQQLINKANSRSYTSRNKYLIKSKLLKSINDLIEVSQIQMLKLQELAQDETEEGKKEFRKKFGEILYNFDFETYTFCTGRLSNELFEAARLTIFNWDQTSSSTIQELTLPEENTDEE